MLTSQNVCYTNFGRSKFVSLGHVDKHFDQSKFVLPDKMDESHPSALVCQNLGTNRVPPQTYAKIWGRIECHHERMPKFGDESSPESPGALRALRALGDLMALRARTAQTTMTILGALRAPEGPAHEGNLGLSAQAAGQINWRLKLQSSVSRQNRYSEHPLLVRLSVFGFRHLGSLATQCSENSLSSESSPAWCVFTYIVSV